jgi:hypothetical protein
VVRPSRPRRIPRECRKNTATIRSINDSLRFGWALLDFSVVPANAEGVNAN